MNPELTSSGPVLGTSLQQGKYRLDQILSQSDYTITYLATHRGLDQSVAVQTLQNRPELANNRASVVQKFIANARKVARVRHPYLAHVKDLFVELELPFMVVDHAVGASLGSIAQQQALSEEQALGYIRQIGAALMMMHQQCGLHGTLHPEGFILREQDHQVVLADLGLERELTPGTPSPHLEGYIAPEQYLSNQGLTPATDVYALAAVLYALVTGHRPLSALSREQTPLSSPRQLSPQLSLGTETAILAGMALKPSDRPQTIAQWLSQLSSPSLEEQAQPTPPLEVVAPENISPMMPVQDTTALLDPPSTPPKTMPACSKPIPRSQFPTRALWLSGGVAGLLGLGFGFVLRFHLLNQFSSAPTATNPSPVKRESFPPRPKADPSEQLVSPTQRLTVEPRRRQSDNFASVKPEAEPEGLTGLENRRTQNKRSNPADLIIESEIGDVPQELTPAGITVSPTESATGLNDWTDVLPSQSAFQTSQLEKDDVPQSLEAPSDETDGAELDDLNLLPPQI